MADQNQQSLGDLLGDGASSVSAFFKKMLPQEQGLQTNTQTPIWTPPAGAGFQGTGYQLGTDGQVIRYNPDGSSTPFVPDAQQQAQLAQAGMPGFGENPAEQAAATGGKNILGGEDAKKVTGALAAALQATQNNKPKAAAPSIGGVGSVMNPTNKLAELFQQARVK